MHNDFGRAGLNVNRKRLALGLVAVLGVIGLGGCKNSAPVALSSAPVQELALNVVPEEPMRPRTANCPAQGFAARLWDYARTEAWMDGLRFTLDTNQKTKELRMVVTISGQTREIRRTAKFRNFINEGPAWREIDQPTYNRITAPFLKVISGNSYSGEFVEEAVYEDYNVCHYQANGSQVYLDYHRMPVYTSSTIDVADPQTGAQKSLRLTAVFKQIPPFSVDAPI